MIQKINGSVPINLQRNFKQEKNKVQKQKKTNPQTINSMSKDLSSSFKQSFLGIQKIMGPNGKSSWKDNTFSGFGRDLKTYYGLPYCTLDMEEEYKKKRYGEFDPKYYPRRFYYYYPTVDMRYTWHSLHDNDYSADIIHKRDGFLYIDKQGEAYHITDDTEKVNLELFKDCYVDTMIKYLAEKELESNPAQIAMIRAYIEAGAIEEFRKYQGNYSASLEDFIQEYGLTQDLDYPDTIQIEKSPLRNFNYKTEKEKLAQKKEESISDAKARAIRNLPYTYTKDRVKKGILTLGLSEAARKIKIEADKHGYIKDAKKDFEKGKEKLSSAYRENCQKIQEEVAQIEKLIANKQKLEETKQKIKLQLEKKFIDKVGQFYNGRNIEIPNCIMFIGENQILAQSIAKWTAKNADTNYDIVPFNFDNDTVQKTFYEKLDQAEERYQQTGKRTVLFVESMQRLLNPNLNTEENIAAMKDYMQCCSEDYHTTIIFCAKNPEKLNPESMSTNRIGLSIDLPITYKTASLGN